MKEINKLTKGKFEIETYLKRERRKKFNTLRGHLPEINYIDENKSWEFLPDLPRLKTIKDVLNISVFELTKFNGFSFKSVDSLIDYIEDNGHKIKVNEGK